MTHYHIGVAMTRFHFSFKKYFTTMQSSTSLQSSQIDVNISKYLTGFTNDDLTTNKALAAFIRANFPALNKNSLSLDVKVSEKRYSKFPISTTYTREKQFKLSKVSKHTLLCYTRNLNETNSRRAKSLRKSNLIPGVIYGSDPNLSSSPDILVKTPYNHLQREITQCSKEMFLGRVYTLTLLHNENDKEGTKMNVTPRDIQYHPIWEKVYCVNFIRYYPGRVLDIPLEYVNTDDSPTIKRGGFIAPVSRTIKCVVQRGMEVPESIHVDCTCLELGDVVRIDRLIIPEGVIVDKQIKKGTFLVGTVFGKRLVDSE